MDISLFFICVQSWCVYCVTEYSWHHLDNVRELAATLWPPLISIKDVPDAGTKDLVRILV